MYIITKDFLHFLLHLFSKSLYYKQSSKRHCNEQGIESNALLLDYLYYYLYYFIVMVAIGILLFAFWMMVGNKRIVILSIVSCGIGLVLWQ